MARLFSMALAGLASMILIAGCGGSNSTASEQPPAAEALLTADQISGAASASGLSEPCQALPILSKEGGRTAISKAISIGDTEFRELVGVFATERSATVAFFGLISEERGRCIVDQLESRDAEHRKVTAKPYRVLKTTESGLIQGYLIGEPGSPSASVVEVVSLQAGRCAAELYVEQASGQTDATTIKLSKQAGQSLARACPPERKS